MTGPCAVEQEARIETQLRPPFRDPVTELCHPRPTLRILYVQVQPQKAESGTPGASTPNPIRKEERRMDDLKIKELIDNAVKLGHGNGDNGGGCCCCCCCCGDGGGD